MCKENKKVLLKDLVNLVGISSSIVFPNGVISELDYWANYSHDEPVLNMEVDEIRYKHPREKDCYGIFIFLK